MYDEVMNNIPDFVHVVLSWLQVVLSTVLEYFGIIKITSHEGVPTDPTEAPEA